MSKLLREAIDWIDPVIVARKLIQVFGEPGLIWLDSDGSKNGRWVILAADPIESICSRGLPKRPSASNPFKLLRSINSGHWTGWMSYEAAAWIEPQNPWKQDSMATLWIARHDPVIKFDLHKHEVWIEGVNQKRFLEISKKLISSSRKESTNVSFAPFRTAGAPPPCLAAFIDIARQGKRLGSILSLIHI